MFFLFIDLKIYKNLVCSFFLYNVNMLRSYISKLFV